MLNPISDNDDEIYLKKEGIDRTVGYLIGGIVVLLFFLLMIMGMGRIQTMSDSTVSGHRAVSEEKVSEIGGTESAGKD